MLKTCMNCSHYHGYLGEEEPSQYHIHDYCDFWQRVLKNDLSELHTLLMIAENLKIDTSEFYPLWDDLEEGISECYMFVPTDTPPYKDSWYRKHHKENLVKLVKLQALVDAKMSE